MEKTLTTGGSSIPGLRGASSQLKKRKRLNAVLDKISHRSNTDNNNGKNVMFGGSEQDVSASQKRELWRDNPQKNVVVDECSAESSNSPTKSTRGAAKAKSLTLTISNSSKKLVIDSSGVGSGGSESLEDFESDVAASPRKSPLSSPQVSLDSPRICFSPLRIKDSIEEEEAEIGTLPSSVSSFNVPKFSIRGCESLDSETLIKQAHPRTPSSSSSQFNSKYIRSISPNPSLQTLGHLPSYLTEIYRRRCLSDTDLSATLEDLIKAKAQQRKLNTNTPPRFLSGSHHLSLPIKQGSSLESDSQESPLDLSIRSNVSSTTGLSLKSISSSSVESLPKSSSATKLAPNLRSSLEIVETSGNPDVSYSCPICGQMFSLHDRLAKHMASRHKSSRSNEGSNTKAYACEVCKRSFARSDMLTRHMRLHTGIKPYTCRICGQVFSRSDHLSTHQRTHTGEKPYRCPTCPYAACRRDMITRHMRTHTRYELNESTSVEESSSLSDSLKSSRSISCESDWNADSKEEPPNKPPSPMDTTDKQTHYNVDKSRSKR